MSGTADIEIFKRRLVEAREAILSVLDARDISAATVELDQSSVGRLSRMDALQQQAMARNTQQRAEVSLRRIEAALARCDAGTYGYCLQCEEPIDVRRLGLDPATPLCIACAEAHSSR